MIRRPEWLRVHSGKQIKSLESELPYPDPLDVSIAARLVAMYRRAAEGTGPSDALVPEESMWGTLRLELYSTVSNLVARGDEVALARHLAKIFRTDAVNGYAYGTTFDPWPHRWAYLPIAIELSVVTLAESLGILRAETHEQGQVAYWRAQFTEEQLIGEIEAFFGFRVEAPRAGDPKGILFGGRFLTRETCSHLYSAHRMREAIDRAQIAAPLDIVEIGGGYGGTCYWLGKILGERIGRYVIVDLPEVSIVQATFLGASDSRQLVLYGEDRPAIELLPHFRLDELDLRPNILINQDSMPEMPQSEVERYLAWGSENLSGLFISFNQEAYSPWAGVPQVHVPTVVKGFPRYRRLARETSWDRRGYVEEIYSTL